MNNHRLAEIARDEDFRGMIFKIEEHLTQKVMAATTSQEDRAQLLAEYHGIQRVKAALGMAAYEAAQQDQE
jgi:hypothetical protein